MKTSQHLMEIADQSHLGLETTHIHILNWAESES